MGFSEEEESAALAISGVLQLNVEEMRTVRRRVVHPMLASVAPVRRRSTYGRTENGVEIDLSRAGKPTDNAKNESLNGRFREERPNAYWFFSLEGARRKIELWREYYNEAPLTLRCSG